MVRKRAPAQQATAPSELSIGDVVEIHGLQGAKDLNGRRGRIKAYVEETGRYGVELEGEKDTKAVKPANLKRLEGLGGSERATLERMLVEMVSRLKRAQEGTEEKKALKKEVAELIQKLKRLEEKTQAEQREAPKPSAKPAPQPAGPRPPAAGLATPIVIQPPPPPREQHHHAPPRQKPPCVTQAKPPRVPPPPQLPERPPVEPLLPMKPVEYTDEHEYPEPQRAYKSIRVVAGAFLAGIVASQAELCPASVFIWTFLAVHLIGIIFLTDYAGESGLLALSAVFGLHSGVAMSELVLWILARDGDDSVGPWSILVLFSSFLYLHSFCMECITLPPDYITSISLFFPMFPAYNAAVALSCVELFVEWRYFPQNKIWMSAVILGTACMACGQGLILLACRTAERNFWASCRNMPEEEEKPEDFVGLEIPNRRIVQERCYRWERHPAYLGAMLWGVGMEVALCNPCMLLVVGFVLWASLLYIALEEEQELYDEFKGVYASYAALTRCWIPLFDSFLGNAAFQREMSENCEERHDDHDCDEDVEEEDAENLGDEDEAPSEDDLLPTWEGVPKGGALWNRQFREPWMLG